MGRGMPKGTKLEPWDDEQKDFLREIIKSLSIAEATGVLNKRFGTSRTVAGVGSSMKRFGISTGRSCRFVKGIAPANKGKTWSEMGISDESQERMRVGQYKPGNKPHNAIDKPIGYERINRYGYTEIKVKDGTQEQANENFRVKHQLVWEQTNGRPVPEGCCIVFADRDKRNFNPENLVCVKRKVLATIARQGTQYHDAESLRAAVLLAEISQKVYGKQLSERTCKTCGKIFKPGNPGQRRCRECLDIRRNNK